MLGTATGDRMRQTTVLTATCEVCGSRRVGVIRHSTLFDFDIARCADCRMVFVLDAAEVTRKANEQVPMTYEAYVDATRGDRELRVDVLTRLRSLLDERARPVLFDVGTGVGEFLLLASEFGFDARGNEIAEPAIAYALEHHGLTISPLQVHEQPSASVDVITLWCVLAHVPDPGRFLREIYAMLRPGGVLFLRTPRWCLIDVLGAAASKLGRGSLDHVADRRVTPGHMHIYNKDTMARHLRSTGFEPLHIEATPHYAFKTDVYLDGAGGPMRTLKRAVPLFDAMIDRGWFVRNTLMVYARRPLDSRGRSLPR